MAFPTVENSTTQSFPSKGDSHDVDIPAGWSISSGDLLLLLYGSFEHPSYDPTGPSGWTVGYEDPSTNFNTLFASYYVSAAGTEAGTSVTVDHGGSVNEGAVAILYHISGWSSVEVSSRNTDATTTTIDIPSLNPSWGAADTLWVEHSLMRSKDTTLSSPSTSYTNALDVNASGDNSVPHTQASAHRENNTGTEDPDSMTYNATDEIIGALIAIEPGSSDTTDPTPGNSGSFDAESGVDANSFTANYTKATDDTSDTSALVYYLYTSESDDVDTVSNSEANGTLQNSGGTTDVAAISASGLDPGTTYYYNVVVEDEAENKAAYTSTSVETFHLGGNITLSGNAEEGVEVSVWDITSLTANTTDLGTPNEIIETDASGDWSATTYDKSTTYHISVPHYNKLEDSGTASSGTTTTITDSGKSWDTDEWSGKMVEITGGTNDGYMGKIDSNTSDTLTVSVAAGSAFDNTSDYEIYTMYGAKTKILPRKA